MKTQRRSVKRRRDRNRKTTRRRAQRGGLLRAPRAATVEYKQDPYSGGVLMSLEEALEFKSNDPIRF